MIQRERIVVSMKLAIFHQGPTFYPGYSITSRFISSRWIMTAFRFHFRKQTVEETATKSS